MVQGVNYSYSLDIPVQMTIRHYGIRLVGNRVELLQDLHVTIYMMRIEELYSISDKVMLVELYHFPSTSTWKDAGFSLRTDFLNGFPVARQ